MNLDAFRETEILLFMRERCQKIYVWCLLTREPVMPLLLRPSGQAPFPPLSLTRRLVRTCFGGGGASLQPSAVPPFPRTTFRRPEHARGGGVQGPGLVAQLLTLASSAQGGYKRSKIQTGFPIMTCGRRPYSKLVPLAFAATRKLL